jgi:DNA-binding NtrC family response regulator
MEKIALLIVDDDADVRRAARLALAAIADTQEAASLDAMEEKLAGATFDAVLLDMNFSLGMRGGQDGLDGLTHIRNADPDL